MSDLSSKYAREHGAYIYFSGKGKTVKLKAFLNDFSVTTTVDRHSQYESELTSDTTRKNDNSVEYSYSFSINIPFNTLAEARAGKLNVDNLLYMFAPDANTRKKQLYAKGVTVLFSNLINNGTGGSSLSMHGIKCYAESFNVEYNSDFGFFDRNRQFYPKLYTISFSLKVRPKNGKKVICRGFKFNGEYQNDDVKYWPFWVESESGTAMTGVNRYEKQYADGHSAYLTISHSSEFDKTTTVPEGQAARKVRFLAFLENFSKKVSYEYTTADVGGGISMPKPKQIKDVGYNLTLQVPANTQKQARFNMSKAQILMRIIAPRKIKKDGSTPTKVKFANLLNSKFYINSVSIKVDTEMGFFEKWGCYYFKNYTLDLELIKIDKDLNPATVAASETREDGEKDKPPSGGSTPSVEVVPSEAGPTPEETTTLPPSGPSSPEADPFFYDTNPLAEDYYSGTGPSDVPMVGGVYVFGAEGEDTLVEVDPSSREEWDPYTSVNNTDSTATETDPVVMPEEAAAPETKIDDDISLYMEGDESTYVEPDD